MEVTLSASGAAGPELVWERYLRPALWPTWSPQIAGVDSSEAEIRAGTTGTVHALLGVEVSFEVTNVDPGALTWSWRVRLPLGITLRLEHAVHPSRSLARGSQAAALEPGLESADGPVPADGGGPGTTTTLRIAGPLPVVLGYAPLAQLALHRLVRP